MRQSLLTERDTLTLSAVRVGGIKRPPPRKNCYYTLQPLNPMILSWKIWLFQIHYKVSGCIGECTAGRVKVFFKLVSNEYIVNVVYCVTQINFVPHIYLWQKTCSFTISSQTEVNRAKTNIKNGLKSTCIIEQLFINTKDMWHNLGKDDHNRL